MIITTALHMMTDICTFVISRWILLRMTKGSDKNCRKKSTHAFYVQKLFSENRGLYEIIWMNIVEPGRPQMTIWRMRIA
jgi:hypothetical protein